MIHTLPLVLQKEEPDFPPCAAHWTHLDNERIYTSSPARKTKSRTSLNCCAKYTFTVKLAVESEK